MNSTTRPLARAKAWAASALLAATVGTAAIGYQLADTAAQTVAAGTASTASTGASSSSSSSTSSTTSSGFGSVAAPSSSSGSSQAQTSGS